MYVTGTLFPFIVCITLGMYGGGGEMGVFKGKCVFSSDITMVMKFFCTLFCVEQ